MKPSLYFLKRRKCSLTRSFTILLGLYGLVYGARPAFAEDETLPRPEKPFLRPAETESASPRPASLTEPESTPAATLLRLNLRDRDFICERLTLNDLCVGTLPSYPARVALFIPHGPHRLDRLQEVRIHLHGWIVRPAREKMSNGQWRTIDVFAEDLRFLRYGEIFQKTDSILVLLESVGRNQTHVDFFSRSDAFDQLVSEVDRITEIGWPDRESLPPLVLSGHSGAFRPIASIAQAAISPALPPNSALSRIQKIKLLDATYGTPFSTRLKWIYRWAKASAHRQLEIHYVPDSDTETGAIDFRNLAFYARISDRVVVRSYVRREAASPTFYDLLPKGYRGRHFRLLMDRF